MFHKLKKKEDRKFAEYDLDERKIMWLRMIKGRGGLWFKKDAAIVNKSDGNRR
jgi:hypothetical protein